MTRVSNEAILEVANLDVGYGQGTVLRTVDLAIRRGEIVALLGNNGAGKSTLLRAVTGSLRTYSGAVRAGTITWQGTDITRAGSASIARRGIALVPEGRHIFSRMTVEDNLRVGAMAVRDRRRIAQTRKFVLDLFPVLARKARERAGLLSGGEQQMIAIGRGLMGEPALLLLDEPFLGLAPVISADIAQALRAINERGTSMLLVEQNSTAALALATRAYVLDVGRVVLSGTVGEEVTAEEVRRHYLGDAVQVPLRNTTGTHK